jgi:hypothetical protein
MHPVMSSTLASSWARTLPSGIGLTSGVQGAGRVDRCGPRLVGARLLTRLLSYRP